MPKRKKYQRLPNSFGSIRYIGRGRSLPYAVHPPAKDRDANGNYVRPRAICYVPDWYTGFAVLSAYHAGTYTPGLELKIRQEVEQSHMDLDMFCRRVLRDHSLAVGAELKSPEPTLQEVFEMFISWKFGESATREYSEATRTAYRSGFQWLSDLHNRPISSITVEDLQKAVNDCPKKHATRETIVLAAKAVYKYALPRHLCSENPAQFLVVPSGRNDERGVPFTTKDIKLMWKHKDDPVAEILLIMCYSGFRLSAYKTLEINLDDMYFRGGIKTESSKNRIVPIHTAILPLVKKRLARDGGLVTVSANAFRENMYAFLDSIGIVSTPRHTPHDCRHTFSALCESYGVKEADRKRMLGHSFGNDITNGVYGHRTIDELRAEILKIPCPSDL